MVVLITANGTLYCQGPVGAPPSQMVCSTTPPGPRPRGADHMVGTVQIIGISLGALALIVWAVSWGLVRTSKQYKSRAQRKADQRLTAQKAEWDHQEEMHRLEIEHDRVIYMNPENLNVKEMDAADLLALRDRLADSIDKGTA